MIGRPTVRGPAALAFALFALTSPLATQAWSELGPVPITNGPYTGRVAAIACSATDSNRYYVGGADGGVWRTDDGGGRWTFVGAELPTTAVGALAIDPNDDDVLWVGTGEANFANHSRYGLGIAKTTDGGATWQLHGEATFGGRCFSRLRVDPTNTSVLYAAVTHAGGFPLRAAARNHPGANGPLGIFKSSDGGATWRQLGGGLPSNLSATDVALDPSNPQIVWAAIGQVDGASGNGVYRSTDGGTSFAKLTLPSTNVGRITLAIAPSQPRRVFAQVARPASATGSGASSLEVWRTDNAGASWTGTNPPSGYQSFGWYYCTCTVQPTNPNVVLIGGLQLERSSVGGGNWSRVTPPHVDLHALEWDAAGRLLSGDDGGVHRSTNLGNSWSSINGNLNLVQFYAGLSIDPGNPEIVHGGTQDNGSVTRNVGSTGWRHRLGGDGGHTAIDATGSRLFMEYQGTGNLFRSINGGSLRRANSGINGRNCFLPPVLIHPSNALLMIYGTERVFRSTNGANSWSPISGDLTAGGAIQGLGWAPSDANTIYAATNDGRVQVTTNGGQSWRSSLTGIPTWPRTTRPFAVHPDDPRCAWFTVASFGRDQVLVTTDAGQRWIAIDGDLPDVPVHCVAIDTRDGPPATVYVGTDRGVWRTIDGGAHWNRYGSGLPNVPVVDLRADLTNERLVAGTQGCGAWRVDVVRRDRDLPSRGPK